MKKSLQILIEERTYDILFELEDELNLNLGVLPEVYYIGRNFNFGDIEIDKKDPGIKMLKIYPEIGFYFFQKKIIISNTLKEGVLGEEIGHFIHHNFVKDFSDIVNDFGASAIGEMIGFFCSKLIDYKRKSPYKSDNFQKIYSLKEMMLEIKSCIKEEGYFDLVHQQGYLMGEKLYNLYISNLISKKEVRKIIQNPLNGHNQAFLEFLRLREKFTGHNIPF